MPETRNIILVADDEDFERGFVIDIAGNVFPDHRIEQFERADTIIARMREIAEQVFLVITDGSMPRRVHGMGEIVAKHAVSAGIPNVVHFSGDDPKYINVPESVAKIEKGSSNCFDNLKAHLVGIKKANT